MACQVCSVAISFPALHCWQAYVQSCYSIRMRLPVTGQFSLRILESQVTNVESCLEQPLPFCPGSPELSVLTLPSSFWVLGTAAPSCESSRHEYPWPMFQARTYHWPERGAKTAWDTLFSLWFNLQPTVKCWLHSSDIQKRDLHQIFSPSVHRKSFDKPSNLFRQLIGLPGSRQHWLSISDCWVQPAQLTIRIKIFSLQSG